MNRVYEYKKLLTEYIRAGYTFSGLEGVFGKKREVLLRHDIDFDLTSAMVMGDIEYRNKVSSSYFFLMRSSLYNLFSKEGEKVINRLQKQGHKVGIHFDSRFYKNVNEGVEKELNTFIRFFGSEGSLCHIVSIHKPKEEFLEDMEESCLFNRIEHTYQPKYFKDITYISDSKGDFLYGHPLESHAFKERETMHLLIHPARWIKERGIDERMCVWL